MAKVYPCHGVFNKATVDKYYAPQGFTQEQLEKETSFTAVEVESTPYGKAFAKFMSELSGALNKAADKLGNKPHHLAANEASLAKMEAIFWSEAIQAKYWVEKAIAEGRIPKIKTEKGKKASKREETETW